MTISLYSHFTAKLLFVWYDKKVVPRVGEFIQEGDNELFVVKQVAHNNYGQISLYIEEYNTARR